MMSIEITIKLNGVQMTMDEARAMYSELHKLFGAKQVAAPVPSIFDKINMPYPQPVEKWGSIDWSEMNRITSAA